MLFLLRRGWLLLLILVVIGVYRGWVSFSNPSPDPASHKLNINLSVDANKIEADAEKFKEKFSEEVGKAKRFEEAVEVQARQAETQAQQTAAQVQQTSAQVQQAAAQTQQYLPAGQPQQPQPGVMQSEPLAPVAPAGYPGAPR